MTARAEIDWSQRKLWTAEQIEAERRRLDAQVFGRWGQVIEVEVRKRITVAVGAYAYEVANKPVMTDDAWDKLAQSINPKLGTCHPILDEFFHTEFSPMTAMWIHNHPDLEGIERCYHRRLALR